MDKGIRPACNAKFAELLPKRAELGNTEFRRAVMNYLIEEFGITLASASTHYNHSFIQCKAANPEAVVGLGRPEDKKGGRKAKVKTEATVATVANPLLANNTMLLLTYSPAAVVTLYTVKKKANDAVVAENLTQEDAEALVQKAKVAKKAALYIA